MYKEASAERTYQSVPWISMLAPGVPDFTEFNAMEAQWETPENGTTLAGCICCSLPIIARDYYCDHCAAHHARCVGGAFCTLEGCGRCDVRLGSPYPWEVAHV